MASDQLVKFLNQEMTKNAKSNKSVILDARTFTTLVTVIEQLNAEVNALKESVSSLEDRVLILETTP